MKNVVLKFVAITALGALLTGCVNPDGTQNNAGSGALIGAGSGALLGASIGGRNAGPAAAIGAVAGLVAGSIIGNSVDEQDRADRAEAAARARANTPPPAPQTQPPSIEEIKSMSRSGLGDNVIISQIKSSRAIYHLDANLIIDLKNSGVSQNVINYMINTPNTAPAEAAVAVAPSSPPPAPVYSQPPAPGLGYVWIDGEYTWIGGRWVWTSGYWAYPPAPGVIWIGGGWRYGRGGYYHERGHWR
jgi:uncharacterized protein YcfJ